MYNNNKTMVKCEYQLLKFIRNTLLSEIGFHPVIWSCRFMLTTPLQRDKTLLLPVMPPIGCRWQPVMLKERILGAEQSVT